MYMSMGINQHVRGRRDFCLDYTGIPTILIQTAVVERQRESSHDDNEIIATRGLCMIDLPMCDPTFERNNLSHIVFYRDMTAPLGHPHFSTRGQASFPSNWEELHEGLFSI